MMSNLHLPTNPIFNFQNSIISFEYVDSYAKIFLILYPPVWKLQNLYCHTGQHLWQLSRRTWKRKNINATYLLFILEGIKIGSIKHSTS